MKIFVSFSEADQPLADSIIATLSAEDHRVFARPERLPDGPSISAQTRAAIELSDRVIFLISPSSIAAGSMTRSDLTLARAKWPNPKGRVIPVLVEPLEEPSLPSYLKGCDLLTPEGDVASEVANAVAMTASRRKKRGPASAGLAGAAAIAMMLIAAAAWLLLPSSEELGTEAALTDVEFTATDDTQLLNWGQLAVYQLVEKRGADPSTYRCKVGPATSQNIASIKHDESCQKIEIQLSDGPFVDDQQEPYQEGYFKPELDRVPYLITTPSGREVFRGHIQVLPYNASVAMILEGLPVKHTTLQHYEIQSGKSYELAVGFRSNPMPAGTRCALSDSSSSFNFTLLGDCRFRIDNVAPGRLAIDVERPGGYKLVTSFELIEGELNSGAASTTSSAPSPLISSEELKNKYPPEFKVFWSDGINIDVTRVGDLQYVGYELSRDGSSYEAITSIRGWRPDEKLLIRISAVRGRGALGPMDFTEQVKDAARKELRRIISANAGPLWCTASHCEIKRQSLCNKGWSKLTLGRSPAIEEITYNLESCPGDPLPYVNYCLSVPGNMPPMKPGQSINGTLHSLAGEPFSFNFETPGALDKNFHSGNSHHFGTYVALEAAEGSESENQPFVLAALSGGISPVGEGVILDIAAGG